MNSRKRILALVLALVVALTTIPAVVLAVPTGSTHSLTTTFTGDNNNPGIMFDVSVTGQDTVVVDGFDATFLSGSQDASVYMRNGTYVGAERSSEGWTLVGTRTVTSTGQHTPTSLDIGGIVLEPGQTYGLFFYANFSSVGYTTNGYTYNDSNLTILPGTGVGGLFTGSTFADRTWNGTVYYHIAHAITASTDSGGTISPSGTTYAASGSSLAYTITPDSGYHIASVLVDGAEQGPIASYTFTNIQGPHTIAASFAADSGSDSGPTYIERDLTNNSGVILSGADIHRSAGLSVRNLDENALPSALREAASGGRMILGYDVSLSRGFRGSIDLSFPVGSAYEGQLVTILHYVNGTVETYTAIVTNGMATVTVNSLSPFVVLATGVTTPDAVVVDPPKTGGVGSAQGLVMVLVALGGIAMLKRRKAN